MAKVKVALTILAALALGSGTIGTAPGGSPLAASLPSLKGGAGEGAAARLPSLQGGAGEGVSPSGLGIAALPAGRPSRVPPVCPVTLGTSPAQVSLCPPCPVVVENPTGLCPPITPPPGARPVISFCPQPPVLLRPVPGTTEIHGLVCGRGFRGSETVTITATGLHGTYSWQVTASSSGSFVTPVPAFLCRLAPVTLVAKGSTGDKSNALSLSASCLVTL